MVRLNGYTRFGVAGFLAAGAVLSGVEVNPSALFGQGPTTREASTLLVEVQEPVFVFSEAKADEYETWEGCSRGAGNSNRHVHVSAFGFSIGGGGGGSHAVQSMGSPAFWGCLLDTNHDNLGTVIVSAMHDDLGALIVGDYLLLEMYPSMSRDEQVSWEQRHPGENLIVLWTMYRGRVLGDVQTSTSYVEPASTISPVDVVPAQPTVLDGWVEVPQ